MPMEQNTVATACPLLCMYELAPLSLIISIHNYVSYVYPIAIGSIHTLFLSWDTMLSVTLHTS